MLNKMFHTFLAKKVCTVNVFVKIYFIKSINKNTLIIQLVKKKDIGKKSETSKLQNHN